MPVYPTKEQNLDRQIEKAKELKIPDDRIYSDKVSGKSIQRPEWQKLNSVLKKKDVLAVYSMSRLSRSLKDLIHITEDLQKRGVSIVFLKENIDTTTPTGRMMLGVVGSVFQFEREILVDRVREGVRLSIETRKDAQSVNQAGHTWGGNQVKDLTEDQVRVLNLWNEKHIKTAEAMQMLGVKSRATLYNLKAKM